MDAFELWTFVTRVCRTLKRQWNVAASVVSGPNPENCSTPVKLLPVHYVSTWGFSYRCQYQKKLILLTLLLCPLSKSDVVHLQVWGHHLGSTQLSCWDQNQGHLAVGHMSQSRFFQKTLQVAQTVMVSDLQIETDTIITNISFTIASSLLTCY